MFSNILLYAILGSLFACALTISLIMLITHRNDGIKKEAARCEKIHKIEKEISERKYDLRTIANEDERRIEVEKIIHLEKTLINLKLGL